MSFIASKLFWGIAAPGNLLVLLLLAGVLRLLFDRRRRGLGLVAAATAALLAIAVLPIGQFLAVPLEARFPMPTLPERVDGIILLGGAVESRVSRAHNGQLALDEAGERVVEALALARRYPAATVVLSGGEGTLIPRGDNEGEVVRDFLAAEGVDPARIVIEDRSRNTYENAVFSRDLVQPQAGQSWVLVTSAVHLPRAVGCFRHAGWSVLPYPADFHTEAHPTLLGFQLSDRLPLVDTATREWIGLAAYRLLGRTDALLPGPG